MHNITVVFCAPLQLLWRTPATYTGVIIWWSKVNDRLLRVTTSQSVPGITCDSCKILIYKKSNKKLLLWVHRRILKSVFPQEETGRNLVFLYKNYLSTSSCFIHVLGFKGLHPTSCVWSNSFLLEDSSSLPCSERAVNGSFPHQLRNQCQIQTRCRLSCLVGGKAWVYHTVKQ